MRCIRCREDKEPREFRLRDRQFGIRFKLCKACEAKSANPYGSAPVAIVLPIEASVAEVGKEEVGES
jgi:hypothetical protein